MTPNSQISARISKGLELISDRVGGVDVQQIRDHAFCDHVKKHPYGRS